MIGEKVPEHAAKMGRHLMDGLRKLGTTSAAIRDVRGRGLLIGIELDRPAGPVMDACRDAGLLVLTAGERVLRLTPPLVVEQRDCDVALSIIGQALESKA